MIRRMMAFLLALCLLPAAFAGAETGGSVRFDDDRRLMTVSMSGLIPGNDYFLLVSEASSDSQEALDNRVYMNVVTASEDGTFLHAAIHKGLSAGQSVLLGGVFSDGVSPRLLGTLTPLDNALPLKLNTIEAEAFMGTAFTSLYIGDTVTVIGDRAFKDCTALRTLYIEGDSVVFGEDVFAGCSELVIVCSKDSTAAAYAKSCENVTCLFE